MLLGAIIITSGPFVTSRAVTAVRSGNEALLYFPDHRGLQIVCMTEWGILIPYPEAEWVFSPDSIMPPRPIERSSRAEGA